VNLILIVADTFRRDYLPCYGSQDVHAPHLTALAERSSVLDRYYAASFPTMPCRADLMLGQWTFPTLRWEPLPRQATPLARILLDAGYTTVGVVDTPFYVDGGFGYDRGFKHFYEERTQATQRLLIPVLRATEYDYCAPRTFVRAEQALERLYHRPFFMLIDSFDPHEPWNPPARYVRRYLPEWDGRVVNPVYGYYKEQGVTEADLEMARACYKAEITMVDRWIGRLLERLESLRIAEQTAVLFTTDHGFYFGEFGIFGKTVRPANPGKGDPPGWARSPLYEPDVHIPLIAHVPGAPVQRLQELISAVDVMPTILDLLGVAAPDGTVIHGRSFAPLLRGECSTVAKANGAARASGTDEAGTGREFVVSAMPLVNPGEMIGIVDGLMRRVIDFQPATITSRDGWSLLYAAQGQPLELYYLPDDPGQQRNVASEQPDVVSRLHAQYVQLLEQTGAAPEILAPRRAVS